MMRKSIIIFVLAIFPLALWADLISFTAPATLRKSDNTETTVLLKYETDTWYEPAGEVYLLGPDDGQDLSGTLIIPSTVTYSATTYTVRKIVEEAFKERTDLQGVVIPSTVTIIGYYTFYRNFDIKVVASIIIPIYV